MAYNTQQLEQLWTQAGGNPKQAPLMAAIAMAESGGNPSAHNPSGATGLWQILGNPFPGNAWDPLTNAKMAVAKYNTQGLGAWTTYTSGAYKKYMPASTSSSSDSINLPLGISLPNPLAPITDTASAIGNVATTIGDFVSLVTSPAFWLRVLECLGGVILLGLGLVTLTGGKDTITTAATTAAKVVK